jgi:hypothetical protein
MTVLELVGRSDHKGTLASVPKRRAVRPGAARTSRAAVPDALALQTQVGNRQLSRLVLQRQPSTKAASETDPEKVVEAGPRERGGSFAEATESVDLGKERHTLVFRVIDGEPVLGVESQWQTLLVIDERIRAVVNVMGTPYTAAWRTVDRARGDVERAKARLKSKETEHTRAVRRWNNASRTTPAPSRAAMDQAERVLRMANTSYTGAANRFLRVAYDLFGEQVALILGALTPTHEKDPAAGAHYGGRRYHEGTATDPIPIIWYKPHLYPQTITVNKVDATGNVVAPQHVLVFPNWPATQVNYVLPGDRTVRNVKLGVDPANQIQLGTRLFNNHRVVSRARQQQLNGVLIALGFSMAGLDGDHVKDLGFDGNDHENNFWPLNSVINQNALVWRRVYRIHYKQRNAAGQWELKSRPIEGLAGRYFRVKGFDPVPKPAESGQPDAGHDATAGWGAPTPGGVLVNGAPVAEA